MCKNLSDKWRLFKEIHSAAILEGSEQIYYRGAFDAVSILCRVMGNRNAAGILGDLLKDLEKVVYCTTMGTDKN